MSEHPPTEGDYISLVAMLRHIQCEPASFDTYSMASAAERAADAIERLRSAPGAPEIPMDPYERAVRLAEEWQKHDETRKFLVSIIELAEQIGGFDHETRWKP